jgi:microsomal epoxide hydrolase
MRFPLLCACLLFLSSPVFTAVQANSATFRTGDGVTLHYFEAGHGPAIVFVPGWTMAADIFELQINSLSSQFRVIALDPRSQGDSEKTSDNNTLERHAKDIEELLEHLQLQSAVLVGWSNGVPDVLTFVEQNGTAKVSGIVLVDGLVNASGMKTSMEGMLHSFQADRTKFTDGFVRSMYSTKQTEEYIAHVKEQSLKTPTNTAVVEIFNVQSRGDFTQILPKIDKPVLYVCEEYLALQGKLVRDELPKARVEVFQKAGHALFVDQADKFNALLTEFARH